MTRSGPKAKITVGPLDLSHLSDDPAQKRIDFIHEFAIVSRGHGAGEPFRLREWQQEIVRGVYSPGIRQALLSLPRGNGKTGLAAVLSLAELFCGPLSSEIVVVASNQQQARITYNLVRRMVELNPLLEERVQVFRDYIYLPENDATLTPLASEYSAVQGLDFTLAIVDELHVVTTEVWEGLTTAAGKRPTSLTLAISTPASSKDTVMYDLVRYGRTENDPSFYLKEFAAPDNCAVDDIDAWKIANPALGDFLAEDGMKAVQKTTREQVFRQLRLGQWVSGIDAWLHHEKWQAIADTSRVVDPEEPITLGFDGSASGDSTALIGCTVNNHHVFVVGLWEKPDGAADWRVPRAEVDATVRDTFDTYNVLEMAADPWGWRSELEAWAKDYGEKRVIEYNTGFRKRMAPATDRMYQAISQKEVTHDGNAHMSKHVEHAVATSTPQGAVITKDSKNSKRKIDALVAGIVALDRAAFHKNKTKKRGRAVAF